VDEKPLMFEMDLITMGSYHAYAFPDSSLQITSIDNFINEFKIK
jgi:hypothetical protein